MPLACRQIIVLFFSFYSLLDCHHFYLKQSMVMECNNFLAFWVSQKPLFKARKCQLMYSGVYMLCYRSKLYSGLKCF